MLSFGFSMFYLLICIIARKSSSMRLDISGVMILLIAKGLYVYRFWCSFCVLSFGYSVFCAFCP
jgi:hypothetical protein